MIAVETTKIENAGRAGLNAGGAANAFGIFHGFAFVGEGHDVDALVADAGADVAGDAFILIRENSKAGEAGVDVHQRGERTGEPAPDSAGEMEVEGDAEDAGQPKIDEVGIVRDRHGVEERAEERVQAATGKHPADDTDGEDDEGE